jgi:ribosomal-protein-alanine N-acetyltransferase
VDGENFIELGYRLGNAFWGNGMATEAALAIKNDALNRLKIPTLISIIHHENQASKNVATFTIFRISNKMGELISPPHDPTR